MTKGKRTKTTVTRVLDAVGRAVLGPIERGGGR